MILKDVNFTTWCKNHPDDHDSKWCRELYPYPVFTKINFSPDNLNIEQRIKVDGVRYFATIKRIELQENGRYRTTFRIFHRSCIQVSVLGEKELERNISNCIY